MSFTRAQEASVSVAFAFSITVFLAAIGLAVDYARWHNVEGRVGDALDASLLQGGRMIQLGTEPNQAARAVEERFLAAAQQEMKISRAKARVEIVDSNSAIQGSIDGEVETMFMALLGMDRLHIARTAKVAFADVPAGGSGPTGKDLEVALILDVTGSMCADGKGPCTSSPKLDALKESAAHLISVVMGMSTSSHSVKIALVPFSERVRLGTLGDPDAELLMKKVTNIDPVWSGYYWDCMLATQLKNAGEKLDTSLCWGSTVRNMKNLRIQPCVTERDGTHEVTDEPPGPNAWFNGNNGNRFPVSQGSGNSPYIVLTGKSLFDPSNTLNHDTTDCASIDAKNVLVPLTTDKDRLLDRIANLTAYGATAGEAATAWGWYVLSPRWASIWGEGAAPAPYASSDPNTGVRKVVVLLTDGAYNSFRGQTPYSTTTVSKKATQLCSGMKAAGVEIFTVGFDLRSLSASDEAVARDTLKVCGSDVSHFYESLDEVRLQNVMTDIAARLATLRLTQ